MEETFDRNVGSDLRSKAGDLKLTGHKYGDIKPETSERWTLNSTMYGRVDERT